MLRPGWSDHDSRYYRFRNRLLAALGMLVAVILAGSAGFALLDERELGLDRRLFDGLWDTLNIVSTVGSLPEFSSGQRVWALLIIAFGLGAVLYGFGTLQAALQRGLPVLIERRRMQKKLEQISSHVLVCGFGSVGRAVAEQIRRHDPNAVMVVIERDEAVAQRAEAMGLPVIAAACEEEGVLVLAGVARARVLVAALPNDAANVFLCLIARELNPDLRILARAEREETRSVLIRAGADQVSVPSNLAAVQLSHQAVKPAAAEFVAAAVRGLEFEFMELHVDEGGPLAGRQVQELDFSRRAQAVVVSVVPLRSKPVISPDGERVLHAGDTLVLVCPAGGREQVLRAAGLLTTHH